MNINVLRYSLFGIAGGQEVGIATFLKHKGNISTFHTTLFSDYSDQSLTKLVYRKGYF